MNQRLLAWSVFLIAFLATPSSTSSLILSTHAALAPANIGITLRLADDIRGWALFAICDTYQENPAASEEENGERVIRKVVRLPFDCEWTIAARLLHDNGSTEVLRDRVSVQ